MLYTHFPPSLSGFITRQFHIKSHQRHLATWAVINLHWFDNAGVTKWLKIEKSIIRNKITLRSSHEDHSNTMQAMQQVHAWMPTTEN